MNAPIVQAQYEELENIARRFVAQAEASQEMRQLLMQRMEALRAGGWIGEAATKFYAEMEDLTFPAIQRLIHALETGGQTTLRISTDLSAAEQEASSQFTISDDGAPSNSGIGLQHDPVQSGSGESAPPAVNYETPPDFKKMSHQEFIDYIGPLAGEVQGKTGVPASVTIAQAILETGWGKATIGEAHNLFGIKGEGPAGSISAPTQEFINGKWVMVDGSFRAYHTFQESIEDHAQFFLENSRYRGALAFTNNPDEFARQIASAGYATDPMYANKLIDIMKDYNLYRFDR